VEFAPVYVSQSLQLEPQFVLRKLLVSLSVKGREKRLGYTHE